MSNIVTQVGRVVSFSDLSIGFVSRANPTKTKDAPSLGVIGVVAERFLAMFDGLVVLARQVQAQAAVVERFGLLRVGAQEVAVGSFGQAAETGCKLT